MATPWICYGQTLPVKNAAVDNPQCNVNGLVGEVTAFPYVVPDGMQLVIEAYGIEAYNVAGAIVLAPWIGDGPPSTNGIFLASVNADNDTNSISGLRFTLPSAKKLNIRIMSTETTSQVVGWYLSGYLQPNP